MTPQEAAFRLRDWYESFVQFGKGNERAVQELLKASELIDSMAAELADTKKAVGYTNGLCDICKHKDEHENECEANDFLCYNCPADCACKECYSDADHYEWRGVQKEE
jgi:hypothetical protein